MKWESPGSHSRQAGRQRTIPALLLTGFLGSGKTTLLNRLLRDPHMTDTAVVINEFGDVAIDHLLVESAIENAVVLQSGCICCTVRGDLVDTLLDLVAKRDRGLIPPFSRVVIETTGLADPSPILRSLITQKAVADLFHMQAVITTIDGVNGLRQIGEFEEARRQVAMADLLILSKADLAGPAAASSLAQTLRPLNPSAELLPVQNGNVTAERLFAALPAKPTKAGNLSCWLKAEAFAAEDDGLSAHGGEISSFVITMDEAIDRDALNIWLASIISLRGDDILRMKGVINVAGEAGPVVVHAAGPLLHEPDALDDWPEGDRRTQIVFIGRNLPQTGIHRSFLTMLRWKPNAANHESAINETDRSS
ncbi:GTP-binding protein [Aquamicrobium sp. LC103]|uniref:CobW family GTP-binding protein n=1 Tax=Aquamicrobium sp. LC103 TaxID=1120658 RepID=UPI00063EBF8C|nr:GTP-binding protein [Aquamicrobium sp. LC103]TKT69209.1 GTP-binding protein [Aquamicrobium sp. LC103]